MKKLLALQFFLYGLIILASLFFSSHTVAAEPDRPSNTTQLAWTWSGIFDNSTTAAPTTGAGVGEVVAAQEAADAAKQCDRSVSFGCSLPEYIKGFYNWSIGAGIALSILMLVYAGYIYIVSSGDPGRLGAAKEIIIGALVGLTLLAGAKLILNLLFA